jgi:hypothetical protein
VDAAPLSLSLLNILVACLSLLGIGLPDEERSAAVGLTGDLEQLRFDLEAEMARTFLPPPCVRRNMIPALQAEK